LSKNLHQSDSSISLNFGYPFFVKIRRFFRRAPLDDATPGEHNQPAACQEDLSEQSPQQDDSASSVTTRSRSRSSTASFKTDTTNEREAGTEIGSRPWENGDWYFAEIVDIKRKFKSHFDQYSLHFYDGEFIKYASRNFFITRQDYQKVFAATESLAISSSMTNL
jgi:hypothetical protein